MSKAKKTQAPKQEKVMTKYDRKMQARKEKEAREKREALITKIVGIAIAVALVGAIVFSIGLSVYNKQKAISGVFVKVGEHEVTGVEYDFYYNTLVTNYLTNYSSFLPYMGLDTTRDFADQEYDENMTWKDAFDEMTMEQLVDAKALKDDAEANGFVHETAEQDYKDFQDNFKTEAENAGVSVSEYYKTAFGKYATEERVAPFVKDTLLISAYTEKLMEDNKPTDAEIQERYESNKNNYDTVDYYFYAFTADIADGATEEETATAMADAKAKADAMVQERLAGEDFQALCDKNNAESGTGPATTTEGSEVSNLVEGATYNSTYTEFVDWVFDEARAANEIEVFEDADDGKYYVVEFVKRNYNEDTNTTISDEIATERVNEYRTTLAESYTVEDVAGELKYLTIEDAEETVVEESVEEETEGVSEEESVTEEATE